MGSRTWFDGGKLLEGERMVRSAQARVRTDAPPHWWEGELILTSERLFFLPTVENPLLSDVAYWLVDLRECGSAGRNRFRVATGELESTFQLLSRSPSGIIGHTATSWVRDIARLRRGAPAQKPLEGRRAAG
jgi:hypothetical protein